jgi:hypothetical protein
MNVRESETGEGDGSEGRREGERDGGSRSVDGCVILSRLTHHRLVSNVMATHREVEGLPC